MSLDAAGSTVSPLEASDAELEPSAEPGKSNEKHAPQSSNSSQQNPESFSASEKAPQSSSYKPESAHHSWREPPILSQPGLGGILPTTGVATAAAATAHPPRPAYISTSNLLASQFPESAIRSTQQRKNEDGSLWADNPLPRRERTEEDIQYEKDVVDWFATENYQSRVRGEWVENGVMKEWAKPEGQYDAQKSPYPREDAVRRRALREELKKQAEEAGEGPSSQESTGSGKGEGERAEGSKEAKKKKKKKQEFLVSGRDFDMADVPLFPTLPQDKTRDPSL